MAWKISEHMGLQSVIVAGALAMAATPTMGLGRLSSPTNLRCEYRVNPLGIDATSPRLSWQVSDTRPGAMQKAYRIIVSTDEQADDAEAIAWDTGKVESDQSVQVVYVGKLLRSCTRYFWKVRTWDSQDQPSEYSGTSWWEMGLLRSADWLAHWITLPVPEDPTADMTWGDWIWNAKVTGKHKKIYLRKSFDIDLSDSVEEAIVKITADDGFVLFVNGRQRGFNNHWKAIRNFDLADFLRPGRNVLAIRANNVDGPGGVLATIRLRLTSGKVLELKTDDTWLTTEKPQDGWQKIGFDDSTWDKAQVVVAYGDEPWKELKDQLGPWRSQYMRKIFNTKGKIARARVHASGLGLYELHINGRRVGNDVFAPGYTHYFKRVQYQTYDVTDLLREGDNALGAVLGNGWWSGQMGWDSVADFAKGHLRLIAQLDIEYADGTQERIVTDSTWRAHPSPITRDTFYGGETYDARLEMPGWSEPGFDSNGWSQVIPADEPIEKLTAQACETIQVTEELLALQFSEPDKGVYVFDFGQNVSGWVRLKVKGPRGTKVRMRFAEELDPNGRIYRENYRGAAATDYYILKGEGEEVWEPRFTYRGFRYCEVTGYPGEPSLGALTFRVVHSAAPYAGKFECSNWLINQIWRNIVWGQRSNMHSVPTDCPQRDERMGWMGDAQAFAPMSCWNMQMARFYAKWMHDVVDSQGADGAVVDVSPAVRWPGAAAPGWGDAVVIVPWVMYQFYGDTRIIEENYAGMVGWVEYMTRHSKDYLYERSGYGDWVAPVASPKEQIGAAYYYYSTKLLSEMAAVIGKKEDAAKYADLAGLIANAFNKKYLDKDGNYPSGTQTANLLPLVFGITPDDRQEAVLGNIVKDVKNRGDHLSTGFLGTPYLLSVLTDRGQHELAYRVAAQTSFPSWGYMIKHGATAIWELWNSDKTGPGMNSRNHFALGSCGYWLFEDLAGINLDPAGPGFKRIIIRPQPVGDLTFARAKYPSMYGLIRSEWHRYGHDLQLNVEIPPNTSAQVIVPTLGKGKVTITEGEVILVRKGEAVGKVPGISFVRADAGSVVFEVGAGRYAFVIEGE